MSVQTNRQGGMSEMRSEMRRELDVELAIDNAYAEISGLKDYELEFLERYGSRNRTRTGLTRHKNKYPALSKPGQGGFDDEFGDIVIKPPDA